MLQLLLLQHLLLQLLNLRKLLHPLHKQLLLLRLQVHLILNTLQSFSLLFLPPWLKERSLPSTLRLVIRSMKVITSLMCKLIKIPFLTCIKNRQDLSLRFWSRKEKLSPLTNQFWSSFQRKTMSLNSPTSLQMISPVQHLLLRLLQLMPLLLKLLLLLLPKPNHQPLLNHLTELLLVLTLRPLLMKRVFHLTQFKDLDQTAELSLRML